MLEGADTELPVKGADRDWKGIAAAALYGLGRKEDENDNRPVIKRMMDRVRDR